jgi:hypothetical protein
MPFIAHGICSSPPPVIATMWAASTARLWSPCAMQ